MRPVPLGLLLLTVPQVLWGATFVVTNLNDSGAGSLRDCIVKANASSASDTITFDGALAGGVISPLSHLPALMGYYGDTLDGDLDDDGHPDITLDGSSTTSSAIYAALTISRPESPTLLEASPLDIPYAPPVPGCMIAGLAIVDFPGDAIYIGGRGGNTVRACHIGLDRTGVQAKPNGEMGIMVVDTDGNTIGGPTAADRNVFVSPLGTEAIGVFVGDSSSNVIVGNYFGTNATGTVSCGGGGTAIDVERSDGTQIGGAGASRNLFCRYATGVSLYQARETHIQGNYFGLGSDGSTPIPLQSSGIFATLASYDNRIGGTTLGARNVFAGPFDAIVFTGSGTRDNQVVGNDFGATADSSEQRDLDVGICIRYGAGPQIIGGTATGAGNYFTPGVASDAVRLLGAGADTRVMRNFFGVLRSGATADTRSGVEVTNVRAFITDNVFARLSYGVEVNLGGDARVYRNGFRACNIAVMVRGRANLGNLSNASTSDDGGNTFRTTNILHIWNGTTNLIRAEGNDFRTTVADEINAKIWDRRDNADLGRVDFDPLAGGVTPTGRRGGASVTLTGVSAMPTAAGAEIAFTLGAPAVVTVAVLNLAGRPVAMVTRDGAAPAGLQRILWGGRTLAGVRAPRGQYLVCVTARAADGSQTSALTTVALR